MRQVFYVPERGDIVRIVPPRAADGAPREDRLLAVLSPQAYNARVGLALVCPIITEVKGYPFEAQLPSGLPVSGVALADRPRSLDWRAHRAEKLSSLPANFVEEILGKLRALIH